MKTLLVIAMVAAIKASPQFVYTVGNRPVYTNGHGYGYTANAGQFEEPIQPIQYVRPLYANNACRNDQGILVPCAFPSSAGPAVYAYNNYPEIVNLQFAQYTGGIAAPVGLTLKDEETEIAAPVDNNLDSIQSVKKREANIPHGYYGGRGYYLAGPANIKNTDYGKTDIKYLTKRDAEESEAKPQPNPYLSAHGYSQYGPANIENSEYGKTGIKYLTKRDAEDSEAKPLPNPYLLARGYTPLSSASIENVEYGKTGIKYLKKRKAEDTEAKPLPNPYLLAHGYTSLSSASIENIDYGKTGIKYLEKREAEADPGYYYSYPVYSTHTHTHTHPVYSTGYHYGAPYGYYGGYYRGYGCRNVQGSIVPCAEG